MTESVWLMWLVVRPTLLAALDSLGETFVTLKQDLAAEHPELDEPSLQARISEALAFFDGWDDRNELYAGLGLTFLDSLSRGDLGQDSLAVCEDLVRQVTAGADAAGASETRRTREELLNFLAEWNQRQPSRDEAETLGVRLGRLAEPLM